MRPGTMHVDASSFSVLLIYSSASQTSTKQVCGQNKKKHQKRTHTSTRRCACSFTGEGFTQTFRISITKPLRDKCILRGNETTIT